MDQIKAVLLRLERRLDSVLRNDLISRRNSRLALFLIVASTALFRIYTIGTPSIDRTAWKEIDYIMISRNYYEQGAPFLYPRVSWPEEKGGITAMELPVVPYLASLEYPLLGVNAFSVRLPTLIAFLLLIIYCYKLAYREAGVIVALLAAFFSALIPLFSNFRNFLFSEPALLFFSVFSVYQYAQWIDYRKRANLIGFILGFSLAVSLKPTSLYLLLPLFWIFFRKHRFHYSRYFWFAGALAVSMVTPILWYTHSYHLAKEYIDVFGVFGGQFGGHDKLQTTAMLSDPAWYRTMMYRLQQLCFGYPGFLMIFIGIIVSLRNPSGRLFLAYLLAIGCFFAIVAEGQIDAPYRQLTIVPAASFFLALGVIASGVLVNQLITALFSTGRKGVTLFFSVSVCVVFVLSLPLRRPHLILFGDPLTPIHSHNWLLSEQIKKFASESAKIILAGEYSIHKGGNDVSPVTYYYSGLSGWTIQEGEWNQSVIDSLRSRGANLFGAINYSREPVLQTFVRSMSSRYEVLFDDPENDLMLLSLTSDNQ